MYWMDAGTNTIQRANLDGSGIEYLVTGLGKPSSIALAISPTPSEAVPEPEVPVVVSGNPQMYWTDSGTDKIQRANLDGTDVQDLVATGLENPSGIMLDVTGGKSVLDRLWHG